MNKFKNYITLNKQKIAVFLTGFFLLAGVVQYAFGLSYVLKLTPVMIGVITALVILFWDVDHKVRLYLALFAIVVGMTAELIGVNTGILFGQYTYSDVDLGIKILGVPLLVGFMWLLVTLSAWQIAQLGNFGRYASVLLAAGIVVIFDFLLEQYATAFGLWSWKNGVIPLLNYITWFVVASIIIFVYSLKTKDAKSSFYGVMALPLMMVYFWLMLIFT